jgi:hypothetical protein
LIYATGSRFEVRTGWPSFVLNACEDGIAFRLLPVFCGDHEIVEFRIEVGRWELYEIVYTGRKRFSLQKAGANRVV